MILVVRFRFDVLIIIFDFDIDKSAHMNNYMYETNGVKFNDAQRCNFSHCYLFNIHL